MRCPHCLDGDPSVWDDVLFHYSHPDEATPGKLKMCHEPWRERCLRCSADITTQGAQFCGAACQSVAERNSP